MEARKNGGRTNKKRSLGWLSERKWYRNNNKTIRTDIKS